jgi:AraC-like DNA-binding protein
VPLEAVWGRLADELLDRLSGASTWRDRFAVLDGVLLRALSARVELPSGARRETMAAWDRLTKSAGRVGVATLAAEVGWSRRHLTEQFANEYGVTPRSLAKVLRFERARRMLVRPDRPTLATVAATCGYSDQAHMVHDWHDLAGSSPTAWLDSEVLPFVQDEDEAEGAQWSHG